MDYTNRTLFEWDNEKNKACLKSRGFDFNFAAKAFLDPLRTTLLDAREHYGEERYILYGNISNRLYCIVYTHRISKIRIISARKANPREVRKYGNRLLRT